jgi:predicted nucleotidyltransferase
MDTAFSVDPQDARRFFERKAKARAAALDQRFEQAWAEAHSIMAMLQSDYGYLRIWQWGSLLDRTRFSEISDIDIAVEGVPDTATFFELYGKAMSLSTLPLDLVELERIEPVHATSIRERGRLVYDGS